MSIVDQLNEEMQVLESIYFEEYHQIDDNMYSIEVKTEHFTAIVTIRNNSDNIVPNIHISDQVISDVPDGITESLPRGTEWNLFRESDVTQILGCVKDNIISESVVVYTITSSLQELLETLFDKKYLERHAKPSMELTDAQLTGTKVTMESFTKWWTNFKVKVEVKREISTKLTGKQLFEQGAAIVEDTVDDGIDVDYSLFANE